MEETPAFKSPLNKIMMQYLSQCKLELAGGTYVGRLHHIHDFDNYLVSISYKEGDMITEPIITGWLATLRHLSSGSIKNYAGSVRMFLRFYSQMTGVHAYKPPHYHVDDSYVPYIFSDDEMDIIYNLIDNYKYGQRSPLPYISLEFPMVIRLLDSNGFRLNELITTQMKDVNLQNGIIKIVNSKGNKQRLVPLDDDMAELLQYYCKAMKLYEGSPAFLFPRTKMTEPLTNNDIDNRFRMVLIKAGLRGERSSKPHAREACLHCLRHRFTLRSIKQLMAKGIHLNDTVPYISIYLGHNSIIETEMYMKFLSELFPDEIEKFDKEAAELIPDEDIWDDWM